MRVVQAEDVRRTALSESEIENGVASGPHFVPFEKGDSSADDGGGAKWRRENPIAIDWSEDSVSLLRSRARGGSYRRPRLQNEQLWGQSGVTWNSVASYLRARMVPDGGIFGHKTPIVRPSVSWLSTAALLALMNAPLLDFALRTFVGSRMQIEVGDLRHLPVPVLNDDQAAGLDSLGARALAAKKLADTDGDHGALRVIEHELDVFTRELYGINPTAELWVVR